ncbi:MAG: hypothetical protein D6731_03285 [Planctomycetota bacterium]|nr:MAG: hypothetical protein D6731_03285 [Planctomycetota bacterium]
MDTEAWVWIVFFAIVGLLRLVSWIAEQGRRARPPSRGPQRPPSRGPQRPPSRGPQRPPSRGPQRPLPPAHGAGAGSRPPQRGETPFQAVLRMLEEAQAEAERAARGASPQASSRDSEPPPVLRARPVASSGAPRTVATLPSSASAAVRPDARPDSQRMRPAEAGLATHHLRSEVAGRQLEAAVASRHLRSTVAQRSLGGLGAGDERAEARARRDVKEERSFWERLSEYTPGQRAVVLHEVMGPPRAARLLRLPRIQRLG